MRIETSDLPSPSPNRPNRARIQERILLAMMFSTYPQMMKCSKRKFQCANGIFVESAFSHLCPIRCGEVTCEVDGSGHGMVLKAVYTGADPGFQNVVLLSASCWKTARNL